MKNRPVRVVSVADLAADSRPALRRPDADTGLDFREDGAETGRIPYLIDSFRNFWKSLMALFGRGR